MMATFAQWTAGARPRTLPAAVAPVLVGTGTAAYEHSFRPALAALALLVALALQVGVNYANDYSDGIRGTDSDRVGPVRLVGQQLAPPRAVLVAAWMAFSVAAAAGVALVVLSEVWWLLPIGVASVAAAWFYTGGSRPYGYAGLGEIFVFVFFGLVATAGTAWAQVGHLTALALLVSVPPGAWAAAILVVNNLRDIPGDTAAGKHTLAVRLGDRRTRHLYVAVVLLGFAAGALAGIFTPWALLVLAALPLAVPPARTVTSGAKGRDLVPVLGATGTVLLAGGVLLGIGLGLGA
jgi:1,4-dihydroxy-2-naphthoate octaprenyltransferase